MEEIHGKAVYAVKNSKGELLNIRISDMDNNLIWNAHKEKRYWLTDDIYKAITQASLINTIEGENARVVKIVEVVGMKNEPPEPKKNND